MRERERASFKFFFANLLLDICVKSSDSFHDDNFEKQPRHTFRIWRNINNRQRFRIGDTFDVRQGPSKPDGVVALIAQVYPSLATHAKSGTPWGHELAETLRALYYIIYSRHRPDDGFGINEGVNLHNYTIIVCHCKMAKSRKQTRVMIICIIAQLPM